MIDNLNSDLARAAARGAGIHHTSNIVPVWGLKKLHLCVLACTIKFETFTDCATELIISHEENQENCNWRTSGERLQLAQRITASSAANEAALHSLP